MLVAVRPQLSTYQKVEGSYDAPYLLVAFVVARLNRYLWQAMIKYKKSDSDANASHYLADQTTNTTT